MTESLGLLRALSSAHGVSGYEDDVRAVILERLGKHAAEHRVDALGNLIMKFGGAKPDAPVLMLDAHMDEIGLVVSYVEPNGFLRFALVGGWDERILPAQMVSIRTQDGKFVPGVIGTPPPHISRPEERGKPFSADSLFIDVGAETSADVQAMGIRVGDSAVIPGNFTVMGADDGTVMGKALDNRAGCTVAVRLLEELFAGGPRDLPVNVVALFSTFEEVGGRGAQAGSYGVDPDIALVLEGTVAADCPGVPAARNPSRQGGGPALTLMDRTAHLPRQLVTFIENLAAEESLGCQLKTPIFGGTNAARIHMVRSGVPTAVMSVPCRYIHSPNSTLRLADLQATIELAKAFVLNAHRYLA